MRSPRPSLWRAPLQAVGMQHQQAKLFLQSVLPNQQTEGQIVSLISEDGIANPFALEGVAAGTGLPASFVWQPGGVAADGVYTTWATLNAATSAVPGAKTVTVDTSLAAAHITAGGPYNVDDITFVGGLATGVVLINLDAGVTFTAGTTNLTLVRAAISSAATATVWAPANGGWTLTIVAGQIITTAAGAFLENAFNGGLVQASNGSSIGDGVHAVIKTDAAGVTTLDLFTGSTLNANALSGVAGGQVTTAFDGSSLASQTQGAGPTYGFNEIDPTPTFVFRAGAVGTVNGNVFSTAAALAAAMARCTGPKVVEVDTSLAACHVTNGVALPGDDTTFVASGSSLGSPILFFDPGATLTGATFRVAGGLQLQGTTTAAAVCTLNAASGSQVEIEENSSIVSTTAQPFFAYSGAGAHFLQIQGDSFFGDGAHAALTVAAGTAITVQAYAGAGISNGSLSGLGTVNVQRDSSSTSGTHAGLTTYNETLIDLALFVSYTPGVAGNWQPAPTVVKAALDQLAAPNFVQSTTVVGGGTHTVTFVTANIAKKKNGIVQVNGDCAGATAAADAITVTLQRDATVLRTKTITTTAGQLNYDVAMSFEDTLPDAANHTYTLSLAGAQNNTVPANGGYIGASEDS